MPTYTVTGLDPETTYQLGVRTKGITPAIQDTVSVTTLAESPLPAPTSVTLSYDSVNDRMIGSWSAVSGAAAYMVTFNDNAYVNVGNITSSSWDASEFPAGDYVLKVRALSDNFTNGNVGTSNTVTKEAAETPPGSAPTNVNTSTVTTSSVRIEWDVLDDAASYRVYRTDGASWVFFGTAGSPSGGRCSYTCQGLTAETAYQFKVAGVNSAGEGPQSATVSATTLAATPGVTVPTVITTDVSNVADTSATFGGIVGDDGGDTVTERGVLVSSSATPSYPEDKHTMGSTSSFSGSVTGLNPETQYYYRAYAVNSAGIGYGTTESFSTPSATVDPPAVPTGLTANLNGTNPATAVDLQWNQQADADQFKVYIKRTPAGDYELLATVSASLNPMYAVTGLNPETAYSFRVSAVSDGVEGNKSTAVSITTADSGVSASVPTVTTGTSENITSFSARLRGTVVSDGGAGLIERGICYSLTDPNPMPGSSTTNIATGTTIGAFSVDVADLTAETTYYYRAYAKNSAGTGVGEVLQFTSAGTQNAEFVLSESHRIWAGVGADDGRIALDLYMPPSSLHYLCIFNNVDIPQGAALTEVRFEYWIAYDPVISAPQNVWMQFVAADNIDAVPTDTDEYNALIANMAGPQHYHTFTPIAPDTGTGVIYPQISEGMKESLQAVINRSGWQSGNSVAMIISTRVSEGHAIVDGNGGYVGNPYGTPFTMHVTF